MAAAVHAAFLEAGFAPLAAEGEAPVGQRGDVLWFDLAAPAPGVRAMVRAVPQAGASARLVVHAGFEQGGRPAGGRVSAFLEDGICRIDPFALAGAVSVGPAQLFPALDDLVRRVLDAVVHPTLRQLRALCGLPAVGCLLGLPAEMLRTILLHLDATSLARCAAVSRGLRAHAQSASLWRRLYRQRWGEGSGAGASVDWRRAYADRAAALH